MCDYKFYYWTVLKCWKLKFINKKVSDKKRVTWNRKFSRLQNPDIHLWRLLWGRRPLLQVAGTFQISCEETQSLRNFEQMVTANDWHIFVSKICISVFGLVIVSFVSSIFVPVFYFVFALYLSLSLPLYLSLYSTFSLPLTWREAPPLYRCGVRTAEQEQEWWYRI